MRSDEVRKIDIKINDKDQVHILIAKYHSGVTKGQIVISHNHYIIMMFFYYGGLMDNFL